MKDWFLVPLDILIAVLYSCVVFRLLNYPVIELNNDSISLVYVLIFKTKIISYRDILKVEKKGSSDYKIVFKSNKSISLQIKRLKKSERGLALSEINKLICS